jgi:Tfp pilus assembly pilus retraction ATPase PilT
MAGMYCMSDLLELSLLERAEELRLRAGEAPVMVIHGEPNAIDVPAMTADDVTELFQSVATGEQLKELRQCGDIHFVYVFQNSARFGVTANMERGAFDVKFRSISPHA